MSIERRQIVVRGLAVEIVRKDIKNLHLGVYPPHGRIRVAVPRQVTDDAVRLAVIGKLGWITRQRARFEAQPRQSEREMSAQNAKADAVLRSLGNLQGRIRNGGVVYPRLVYHSSLPYLSSE